MSEQNRAGTSSSSNATRALETLNQEIAEHNLDQARVRTNFERARATVDRQIQQLQSEIASPAERIRNIWYDQLRAEHSPHRLSPESRPRRRSPPWPALTPSPNASRSSSLMSPPAQLGRDEHGRQKRRKLETDDNREGFKGFNYGLYGQVMPGELKMEIASCDGGNYDPDGVCSRPENVLNNNQTVYSTKEDRCNLVLCHRDEAPFCLKKIVIRAPQGGFDAPYVPHLVCQVQTNSNRIQEGMVFVAMTSDELLARTAQYQIQYSNPRQRRRFRRSGLPPSQEYLSGFRPPLQNLERTVLMGPNSHSVSDSSEDPQAHFRITTEYDENSEDNAYPEPDDMTADFDATQEPTQRYMSDTDETPSEEEDEMNGFHLRRTQSRRPRRGAFGRYPDQRVRREPSLVHPNPPESSHSAEVLKPHARFFIEREKSMVTIKFDPPPYVSRQQSCVLHC